MGKLHELIAVEDDAKKTLAKILTETQVTFTKKDNHFDASSRTYQPFTEGDRDIPEEEVTHMVTTVKDKLVYTLPYLSRVMDIIYQKESANTTAKADIILNGGEALCKDVPVLVLVQFENLLENFRKNVLDEIPTLDPKIDWVKDQQKENVWKTANAVKTIRTKKITRGITLAAATDKFPAQVQAVNEDMPAGEFIKTAETGRFSPAQKSEILAKIDKIIAAIKTARARANDMAVGTMVVGKKVADYILS